MARPQIIMGNLSPFLVSLFFIHLGPDRKVDKNGAISALHSAGVCCSIR